MISLKLRFYFKKKEKKRKENLYQSTLYFIVIKIDSSGQRRGDRAGDKRGQR
jgi:hypothetical protein